MGIMTRRISRGRQVAGSRWQVAGGRWQVAGVRLTCHLPPATCYFFGVGRFTLTAIFNLPGSVLGASVASTGKSSRVWAAGASFGCLPALGGGGSSTDLLLPTPTPLSAVALGAVSLNGRASVGAAFAGLDVGSVGFSSVASLRSVLLPGASGPTGKVACAGVSLARPGSVGCALAWPMAATGVALSVLIGARPFCPLP